MSLRPSKPTIIGIVLIAVASIAAFLVLETGHKATPGEVVFLNERPPKGSTLESSIPFSEYSNEPSSMLGRTWEGIVTWDKNPWKRETPKTGSHYFKLSQSSDPLDQQRAAVLRSLADDLHRLVLERYPELAITMRKVAPEKNGFLQMLELSERLDAEFDRSENFGARPLAMPTELKRYLRKNLPWPDKLAEDWLTQERANIDEVCAIGLLPDQSVANLDTDRWVSGIGRIYLDSARALLLNARLSVASGDTQQALLSVRAARGLASQIGNIESPALIHVLVAEGIQNQIEKDTLTHLIPNLPDGQFDSVAWKAALNPRVFPPSKLSRVFKGDWNISAQDYVFPILCDPDEPNYPSDPGALIDLQASYHADLINAYDLPSMTDWAKLPFAGMPETGHLSRQSREILEMSFYSTESLTRNLAKAQVHTAMIQAAFAIMQGQPIPPDPIQGLPYLWDPATRTLSPPDSPFFAKMKMESITVPNP